MVSAAGSGVICYRRDYSRVYLGVGNNMRKSSRLCAIMSATFMSTTFHAELSVARHSVKGVAGQACS